MPLIAQLKMHNNHLEALRLVQKLSFLSLSTKAFKAVQRCRAARPVHPPVALRRDRCRPCVGETTHGYPN